MDGPNGLEVVNFSKVPDSLEVLDPDALVILGPAGEYPAVGSTDGGEGRVGPLVGLNGDGVQVGVEEGGREVGPGPGPGEEKDGLTRDVLDGSGQEPDGARLVQKEGDRVGVVRVRVGRFETEVGLEPGDGSVSFFLSFWLMGCNGRREKEEEEDDA